MKISTRLLVLVGSLIVAMLGIGVLGLYGVGKSNASLKSVYQERTSPAVALGQIDALTTAMRMNVAEALANPTPEVMASSIQQVQAQRAQINTLWVAYTSAPLQPVEQAIAQSLAANRKAFEEQGLMPALAGLQANDITEAQEKMVNKMTPLALPLKKDIDALKQYQVSAAQAEFEQANQRYGLIQAVTVVALLLGSILAGALGFAIMRSITTQLGGEPAQANAVAQRVGAGDLAVPIALAARDSRSLMARLQAMQGSL